MRLDHASGAREIVSRRKALSTRRCIETDVLKLLFPLRIKGRKALSTRRCIETASAQQPEVLALQSESTEHQKVH